LLGSTVRTCAWTAPAPPIAIAMTAPINFLPRIFTLSDTTKALPPD
jgi:hypothetical protein